MNSKKPSGYWTKEECIKVALTCKSRTEFKKKYSGAWGKCREMGWMDEVCAHMVSKTLPHGYWQNPENCYNAAKQCLTNTEFERRFPQAYRVSKNKKWKDTYTWFKSGRELFGQRITKWTYQSCYEESKRYKTRSEFQKGSVGAYQKSIRKGWIDDFTWLNRGVDIYGHPDCVYKYEFEDFKTVYVGRTIRKKDRAYEHVFNTDKDPVAKFALEHSIPIPEMEILADHLTLLEGQDLEDIWKNYFIEQGYYVLNKAKTGKNKGSLGSIGFGKWTYDTCYAEAKKYKTRKEFQRGNVGAYTRSLQYNWFDDYHWFDAPKTGQNKWTKDKCFNEAKKYCYIDDFRQVSRVAYEKSRKNGWIEDYIWLVKKPKRKSIPKSILYWTKERCYEEARKYKSRMEFQYAKGASMAYKISIKNGWIDEYEWMKPKMKPNGYWNYDRCYEEAKKYKSRTEFQYAKGSGRAYKIAVTNGWIDDYKWFLPKKKSSGYWSRERCKEEAMKYSTRGEFKKKSASAYTIANRNGWSREYDWLKSQKEND